MACDNHTHWHLQHLCFYQNKNRAETLKLHKSVKMFFFFVNIPKISHIFFFFGISSRKSCLWHIAMTLQHDASTIKSEQINRYETNHISFNNSYLVGLSATSLSNNWMCAHMWLNFLPSGPPFSYVCTHSSDSTALSNWCRVSTATYAMDYTVSQHIFPVRNKKNFSQTNKRQMNID